MKEINLYIGVFGPNLINCVSRVIDEYLLCPEGI